MSDPDTKHIRANLEAQYHRRPSQWVSVEAGDWRGGGVELVEFPTASEFNDNIVAYWSPDGAMQAGEERRFRYRLVTFDSRLQGGQLAVESVDPLLEPLDLVGEDPQTLAGGRASRPGGAAPPGPPPGRCGLRRRTVGRAGSRGFGGGCGYHFCRERLGAAGPPSAERGAPRHLRADAGAGPPRGPALVPQAGWSCPLGDMELPVGVGGCTLTRIVSGSRP